jgi:hypothetical protein
MAAEDPMILVFASSESGLACAGGVAAGMTLSGVWREQTWEQRTGSSAEVHTVHDAGVGVGRLRWLAERSAVLERLCWQVSKALAVVWRKSDHLMIDSMEVDCGGKETTK